MKNIFLAVGILFVLFSCKKSNSGGGGNAAAANSYVSSVRPLTPQTQTVDSFLYNSVHQVAKFIQYKYDTSSGTPEEDSLVYTFAFSGGGTLPSGYTALYPDYYGGSITDVHQLTYDGQSRVTKDTSVSGSGYVTFFTYPTNMITARVLFDGTAANNQIDTFLLSNGNMTGYKTYFPNDAGTADSLEGDLKFGFSSYANPLYHAELTPSAGPLLTILSVTGYGNITDFISENMFTSISGTADGLPAGVTVTYTVGADKQGRVSTLSTSSVIGSGEFLYTYY